MKRRLILPILVSLMFSPMAKAQQTGEWNGKRCAVVLTYDDALDVHLDNVIPALDSLGLKGTFYVVGNAPALNDRLPEWREAAREGHELGNHSLNHPCDGQLEGRSWVSAENDLSRYSVARAVNEIKVMNTLLKAIDGKTERSFAFPCGDKMIDTVAFYDFLKDDFAGARGVVPALQTINQVNLDDIRAYPIIGHSAEYMIDLVKQAEESGSLLVFLFHGVGGGHDLNVSLEAHRALIRYLHDNECDIWVAPMVDVAGYIRRQTSESE
ncbi:polysaccharide deacetylase family protein [Mangrovibacterium diazotrophicum]|uniref:Peptidoglycan/xylan/chitin deacetylase (PgdA/CDA1 family) n=1 Tax=Mangrovibacterium diazotrophicum TaxID=1261403 RepID=A0A419VV45_9BACT|nr:polysaccharide deacetylase family protein [Mangrovibacterium diazotrophicum]RKD85991.1 peptidoglycan/xylan/chitin deacetylase (PgdA/CDA1 family) [Mangrovibacterium diazotrophicum]